MNLTSYTNLNATATRVTSAEIIDEQLVITFKYYGYIDNEYTEVSLGYDSNHILSPRSRIKFYMAESTGIPLEYS